MEEIKPMWYRILGTSTIQLSDYYLEGYSPVIEEPQPEYVPETQYLRESFEIVDNTVHRRWYVEEIPPQPEPEVE